MQLDCWNIQGESFHFGRHGLGQEQTLATMPSDSLFAALVARLARTEGSRKATDFCKPFAGGNPPFVLSSTFPFAGAVKFLPAPMLSRGGEAQGNDAKKLKRVEYVSEEIFRSLLKREPLAKFFDEKLTLQKGKVLVGKKDFEKLPAELKKPESSIWDAEPRPRVTLDRATSAPNLFHIGQVYFAKECGLWFAIRWVDAAPEKKKQFKDMLHELAEAGFGAERGVGMGIAKVHESGTLDLPEANGAWVTLSRYLPKEDEVSALGHDSTAYSIKAVGGWVDSPTNMGQRRKPVNLIEEGSVIGEKPPRDVPGQMVDVQPTYRSGSKPLGHEVYRNGFALAVGMEGGAG